MKNKQKIICIMILVSVLVAIVVMTGKNTEGIFLAEQDADEVASAMELLVKTIDDETVPYIDYRRQNDLTDGTGKIIASLKTDNQELDYGETVTYEVNVEKSGSYYIELEHRSEPTVLSEFAVDVKINDTQPYKEMQTIILPLKWQDETKEYQTDRYGDQTVPKQLKSNEWQKDYLYDTTYLTALPLEFYLEEGKNTITIKNISADGLEVGTLMLEGTDTKIEAYDEYIKPFLDKEVAVLYEINATDYVSKNGTDAIYGTESDPSVTPYEVGIKQLNTVNYQKAGIQLDYEIEVEEEGLYELALHYRNKKEEFGSFISIYIDDTIPFAECMNYFVPATGNKYKNVVLSDEYEVPYKFYLTEGTHKISIRSEQEPLIQAWRYGRVITQHITQLGLDITKIAGNEIDKNRTWKMTNYIENIPEYLEAYEVLINEMRILLQEYATNGAQSALFTDLDKALMFLENIQEYPDEIALHINELTGKDASILAMISAFTTAILEEDMSLDSLYVYSNETLPKETVGIVESISDWFATLIHSFTTNKYDVVESSDDSLTIWVNRALTHVDLLQRLVDSEFTPKTGIEVKISAMPDVNKLIMAAAAKDTPDIALGLSSHIPFELASRGALYDMTQFDNFWDIAGRFGAGVFVPYTYNEGVYALPETMDFHVLAYREDIFENLGLEVPGTWEALIDTLPTLQRYGMNFYHNIAVGSGYKWFYQTSAMIFQNQGEIYTKDGLSSALDQANSVKGLQLLGDLFLKYSVDPQVSSFLSAFRYSTLPIGIIDNNEYVLLKNGAPELEGKWTIAPYLGTKQADGTIDRSYVAGSVGGVIFEDTKMPQEAFDFLEWWTSHETQVNYTHTLKSTYGDEFFWVSANLEALADSPIPQKEKEVILEQVKWIKDVPRTPGQYLVERSISDAWNDMVFKGISAQVAIDEKIIPINREIKKKMTEIGFYSEDGTLQKPYAIRDAEWISEQIQNAKEGGQ